MDDKIKVQYDIIEQLFCQKTQAPKSTEKKKTKTLKEASFLNMNNYVLNVWFYSLGIIP